jgi:NitT/TauT family transport system substrate-binding protein
MAVSSFMMKRFAVCCVAVLLALGGLPATAKTKHKTKHETTKHDIRQVTVAQGFQSMLYLPLYVAIHQGFFTQQKLKVNKITTGSPSAALATVLSGKAQFSVHGPEWTAIAASKGKRVNIISNLVNKAAAYIAAVPDFDFDSAESLRGQKVVVGKMPTTSTSLFIKLLRENGMKEGEDVELIQAPLGGEPGPLLQGQAKVAVLYEPQLSMVIAKGMRVVLNFPEIYDAYAFSSVTARTDVDPDLAQRLVNGIQLALNFIQDHPEQTLAVARKEFPGMTLAVLQGAAKNMLEGDVYPRTVAITPDAFKTAMETQLTLGNLEIAPDYTTFVVPTYWDQALNLTSQ